MCAYTDLVVIKEHSAGDADLLAVAEEVRVVARRQQHTARCPRQLVTERVVVVIGRGQLRIYKQKISIRRVN